MAYHFHKPPRFMAPRHRRLLLHREQISISGANYFQKPPRFMAPRQREQISISGANYFQKPPRHGRLLLLRHDYEQISNGANYFQPGPINVAGFSDEMEMDSSIINDHQEQSFLDVPIISRSSGDDDSLLWDPDLDFYLKLPLDILCEVAPTCVVNLVKAFHNFKTDFDPIMDQYRQSLMEKLRQINNVQDIIV